MASSPLALSTRKDRRVGSAAAAMRKRIDLPVNALKSADGPCGTADG